MTTETSAAPLDAAHLAQYHAEGFLAVRDVFSRDRIEAPGEQRSETRTGEASD